MKVSKYIESFISFASRYYKMKIIIAGAGFAGLQLARSLNQKKGIEVLLIDKNNYHQFQPLFYQVATAGLDASNISFPLRKIFQGSRNVRIRIAEIEDIDSKEKTVRTSAGQFQYDLLVLAQGATTNFFGNKAIEANAFPMKTTVEALQLRHRLIENFEKAVQETNAVKRKALLTIVVTGAGPTGVEVSGALAEMKSNVLQKDYPELDLSDMQIHLIEGSDRTLASMSTRSSEQSKNYLSALGVHVWLNSFVNTYENNTVTLSNGETIDTAMLIWAAGIKGNTIAGLATETYTRGNRITVNRYNQIENDKDIFAIGDVAYMETPLFPKGCPQVANVAINQAKFLAKNIIKMQAGDRALKSFEYEDKGSMATVGRHLAVVDIPALKLHFGGFFAWLIWMGLHLLLILGVKNRIQVFINWMYKYFTYDQSLRLLFINTYRSVKNKSHE